jgi:hypothetical protein
VNRRPSENEPPLPSWSKPLAIGAIATFVLHAPVLADEMFWFRLALLCGSTGMVAALFSVLTALRHDPRMGAASGFALGFTGVGIGALALAVLALIQGFELSADSLASLEKLLRANGTPDAEIRQTLDQLVQSGPFLVAFGALLLALNGGVIGAVVAGLRARRFAARDAARPPSRQAP